MTSPSNALIFFREDHELAQLDGVYIHGKLLAMYQGDPIQVLS
jgi:hypothetical protein